VFNSLGQLTSYTDADGNTSTYTYDIDGRPEKTNDGKGSQTFTYDTTTGLVSKLVDSAAGTFTGAYDIEGKLTTEGYPNGMNVKTTFNPVGEATALEYVKTTHCTEKCTWFSDSVSPSISGQWLSQTSTLSGQNYTYDAAGRLTQVQDTPAGKGCTTRIYAYEVETNRTSLTTRNPTENGACATSGGTVESHTYDVASRLLDNGTSYDTFGNVTKLPAVDAGGAELTSTYYVDNTLATQSQGGQTIGYYLDPAGRVRESVSTGLKNSTLISHYAGASESPAWTVDTSGNWTRTIMGIGGFAATQYNGEAPVLQIENLHGDVVGTASISETATGLTSTNDTSEYGVPRTSSPPKYSWLGGDQKSTELASGVVAMGARSYVPQLGRFLQTDPVPGGSANAYSYVQGNPVNESDPSGEFVPKWFEGAGDVVSKEMEEAEAARKAAAALAAAAASATAPGPAGADPHCTISAHVWEAHGDVYGNGSVRCDKALPKGTLFEFCLQDIEAQAQICGKQGSGWNPFKPHEVGVWPLHANFYDHAKMECYSEQEYEAVVWLVVPHVHRWRVHTKRIECDDQSGDLIDFSLKFVEPEPPED
jgi:RHS repeat-associated protein